MGLFNRKNDTEDEKITIKLFSLFQESKWDEALKLVEKYDRKTEAYHYTKGNILCNLNRNEEGLESYQKALELDPKYIKAIYRIGEIFFYSNEWENAHSAFEDVVVLEQENKKTKNAEWEWIRPAIFYIILCRHSDYLSTKNPEMLDSRNKAVEMLEKFVRFDYGDEDKFELFEREYRTILDKLEPNIALECRVDEDVNELDREKLRIRFNSD